MTGEEFYAMAGVVSIILLSIFTVCLVFVVTNTFNSIENILIIIAIITGLIFVLGWLVIGCLSTLNNMWNWGWIL